MSEGPHVCLCLCVRFQRVGVYDTVGAYVCVFCEIASLEFGAKRGSRLCLCVCLHVSTPSFGHGSEPVFVMRDPLDDLIG